MPRRGGDSEVLPRVFVSWDVRGAIPQRCFTAEQRLALVFVQNFIFFSALGRVLPAPNLSPGARSCLWRLFPSELQPRTLGL